MTLLYYIFKYSFIFHLIYSLIIILEKKSKLYIMEYKVFYDPVTHYLLHLPFSESFQLHTWCFRHIDLLSESLFNIHNQDFHFV